MKESIGTRVRQIREKRGMSQDNLAKAAGITQPTLSSLERGQSTRSGYLAKLAQVLKVNALWLETGEGPRDLPYVPSVPVMAAPGCCGGSPLRAAPSCATPAIDHAALAAIGATIDDLFFIVADGDGMRGTIYDGDNIVFSRSRPHASSGLVWAIRTKRGLTIRRIHEKTDGQVALEWDNTDKSRFPDECYPSEAAAGIERLGFAVYRGGSSITL